MLQVLFLCVSIGQETEIALFGISTKTQSSPLSSQSRIRGENDIIFLFSHFFLLPQKGFMTAGRIKLKFMPFLISIILGCLG